MSDRLLFIGVSTSGSSIFELFPRWAEILGIEASLEGYDIPLGAPPESFRAAVELIAGDPERLGALVTAHKVDVYRHADDLFAELDSNAHLCGEISCISKRGARVVGHAKDPITAGRTLAEFVPPGHWESGAHVLCLGAGGAGTAIVVHLAGLDEGPEKLVVSDTNPARLDSLAGALEQLGALSRVRFEHVSSAAGNDALLQPLAPRSLVVNATGLGKDAPGSPISDDATFPPHGLVWELNYRGDLRFLQQGRQQAEAKRLKLHDGWRYFLHGWSEVIAEVFHLDLTEELFEQLAEAAEPQRPVPA
jgi:shikimate dehydrogenase